MTAAAASSAAVPSVKLVFRHTFSVVRGGPLLLLGSDWLAPRQGNVCVRTNTGDDNCGYITVTHPRVQGRVRLPLSPDPPQMCGPIGAVVGAATPTVSLPKNDNYLLFNVTAFRVNGREERVILLRAPEPLQSQAARSDVPLTLLVKPLEARHNIDPGVIVAWSICEAEGKDELYVPVRLINVRKGAVTVQAMTPLAEVESCVLPPPEQHAAEDAQAIEKVLSEVTIDPQNSLSADQVWRIESNAHAGMRASETCAFLSARTRPVGYRLFRDGWGFLSIPRRMNHLIR